MDRNVFMNSAVSGIAVGIGILIAGIVIGIGLSKVRTTDRFVTVKGLAEREVDADVAIWPIIFRESDNVLTELQRSIEAKRKIITQFFLEFGFTQGEISNAIPKITDNQASLSLTRNVVGQRLEAKYRYSATVTVTLRSTNVEMVKKTMEKSGTLIGKGIVIAAESRVLGMIEEATKNVREAADKFAKDSGSKVGKIRKATQGIFSIENKDRHTPEKKIVRVVTTVEYYLVDK